MSDEVRRPEYTVEIQVSPLTVQYIHTLALRWDCSIDEALNRLITEHHDTFEPPSRKVDI